MLGLHRAKNLETTNVSRLFCFSKQYANNSKKKKSALKSALLAKIIDLPERKVYQMANIRENKKGGKTVSYRFTVYLEKDMQDKQIRRYTTWTPPDGLTPSIALKAAKRAADIWGARSQSRIPKRKVC